jgi:hypothetical protein
MKTKDQILLEQAYNQVVEENWKAGLAGLALAAANILGVGNAKADTQIEQPNQSIQQIQKKTAEDVIPRKEYEEVLGMLKQAVQKGDLVTAKKIYLVINQACMNACMEVSGSDEIHKLAAMDAQACEIYNSAYLGKVGEAMQCLTGNILQQLNK